MSVARPFVSLISLLVVATFIVPSASAGLIVPCGPSLSPLHSAAATPVLFVPGEPPKACTGVTGPEGRALLGFTIPSLFKQPSLPGPVTYQPVNRTPVSPGFPVFAVPGAPVVSARPGTGSIEGIGTIVFSEKGELIIRALSGTEYRVADIAEDLRVNGTRVWFRLQKNQVLRPGSTSQFSVIALYRVGTETVPAKGTVRYVDLEGGFYGIIADDGTEYLPLDLPSAMEKDGLRITFQVTPVLDYAGIQMWGDPVVLAGSASVLQEAALFLTFTRSGGLAGVDDTLWVHTDGYYLVTKRFGETTSGTLSSEEMGALRTLVTGSFANTSGSAFNGSNGAADLFMYTITYGGRSILAEEISVPDTLCDLFGRLVGLLDGRQTIEDLRWNGVLAGTSWKVTRIADETGTLMPALAGADTLISFTREGMVVGTAGCNFFSGNYSAGGNTLQVEPLIITEMYCSVPDGVMDQESAVTAALANARTYSVKGQKVMLISDGNGLPLMELGYDGEYNLVPPVGGKEEPEEPVSSSLARTSWQITRVADATGTLLPVVPGTDPEIRFGAGGLVSGTAGCNQISGKYFQDQNAITITDIALTKMYCGSPVGVMDQESAVINALSGARTCVTKGQKVMVLSDAEGKPLMELGYDGPDKMTSPVDWSVPPDQVISPFVVQPVIKSDPCAALQRGGAIAGTRWEVVRVADRQGELQDAIAGTEPVLTFGSGGLVSGTSGCNRFSAEYEEGDGTLQVEPAISTLMNCVTPEGVMDQESAVTNALSGANTYEYSQEDTLLIYGDDGTPLLELRYLGEEEPMLPVNDGNQGITSSHGWS